jgi:rSAM/selenodomain-associated transferase 1
MTKAPEAGKVKTRLTPPLTAQEAAELNRSFLRDIASSIAKAAKKRNAAGVAVYTPIGSEAAYDEVLPPDFSLLPQQGEGFGERLALAVEDLLSCGFESVCLINSDSPTVPDASFAEAVGILSKAEETVVLGPSDDGGYYLIGVKKLQRRLFEEIDWSTGLVLSQTIERATEIGLSVHQLPAGYDVDDQGTLHRLCDELLGPGARGGIAPNTRKFLSDIITREGRERIWPV